MRKKLSLALDVLRSPKITVRCFGDEGARDIFTYFNSRHPKLPLFKRKTFGAALREIPTNADQVMEGSNYSFMRRQVRKAQKSGFTFRRIDQIAHFDDIMRINLSSESRQGGRMTAEYVEATRVQQELARPGDWFGIFSANGSLEAYAHVPVFGDAFVFWKILGNAALLSEGIMYLLVFETMCEMADRRKRDGGPSWAMYDMYIGGADGLREFKRRTGFTPRRVAWQWVDR
jgi:hypothetical protein